MTMRGARGLASWHCRWFNEWKRLRMSESRKHALQIFRAALGAADPGRAVLRNLRLDGRILIAGGRRYSLSKFDRIQVIGAGKASAAMAAAVERLLGPRTSGGLINVPAGTTCRL